MAALIASFPRGWGALLGGALARRAAGALAPGSELRLARLTPWQAEVAGMRLGSGPDAISCERALVRYSPVGLCRRQIAAVELRGVSVVAEASSNGLALAGLPDIALSQGGGGGWRLERLKIDSLRATLHLFPENVTGTAGRLVCELSAEVWDDAPAGGGQAGAAGPRLEVRHLRGAIVEASGGNLDVLQAWLPIELALSRASLKGAAGIAPRDWQLEMAGEVALPRLAPFAGAAARHLRFAAVGSLSNLSYQIAVADFGGAGWGSAISLPWRVDELALRGTAQGKPEGGYAATAEISLRGGSARHALGAVSNLHLRLPLTVNSGARGEPFLAVDEGPRISWEGAEAGGVTLLCDGFKPVLPRARELRLGLRAAGSALTAEAACGFGVEGLTAALSIPAVALAPDDALWPQLAGGWEGASILTGGTCSVSGTLAAEAWLALARGQAPRWRAEALFTNGVAHGAAAGQGWSVTGLVTHVEAAGGRAGWRMAPSTTSLGGARFGGLALDGGSVRWQWLYDELLVERAELGWCGGEAQFYGLRFDPRDPALECVLYLDRLDAGRLLALIKPLEGTATGHLYGRLPLRLRRGRVRLTDGFLFALPGERGNLQLRESRFIDDYLARSGLPAALRKQIGAALRNLDYQVLRFDLSAGGEPEARLGIRIEGESATDRKLPPVALDINIKGPLEALLNLGLQVNK